MNTGMQWTRKILRHESDTISRGVAGVCGNREMLGSVLTADRSTGWTCEGDHVRNNRFKLPGTSFVSVDITVLNAKDSDGDNFDSVTVEVRFADSDTRRGVWYIRANSDNSFEPNVIEERVAISLDVRPDDMAFIFRSLLPAITQAQHLKNPMKHW